MIHIGFIGLDTSHPASFVDILNNMDGVQVSAVYDDNAVRDADYVNDFCEKHHCQRFDDLKEMASQVDAAMILGVNWDVHFAQAEPFLHAGKAVYVDKPLCGNAADLQRFANLVSETKTPFLAGSGWRFNEKVLLAAEQIQQSNVSDVYVESCLPAYFYGIHAVELAIGLLGSGFQKVNALHWDEAKAGLLFTLEHESGKHALIKIAPSQQYWRGALFRIGSDWQKVTFEAHDIHGSVCNAFIQTVRERKSLYSFESCSESVRIMLAAKSSAQRDKSVAISESLGMNVHFKGADFLKRY